MSQNELYHYGVIGMKWGVHRSRKDNTSSGSGRRGQTANSEDHTARNKKIAKAIVGATTVAAAAYYVHKNPEVIGKAISKFRNVKVNDLSKKAVNAGKNYVKASITGMKEGVKEAAKEAPKKAVKTVISGMVLNQTKRALDSAVGKEESARIFQANDNKKIGKFWKVSDEDKDD